MKFQIICYNNGNFYISLNKIPILSDYQMAKYLDLSLEKYRDILKASNGVSRSWDNNEIEFTKKEDAEAAIKILEPYLVMAKLVGNDL